eukprot:10610520-Lingulodinium_polyedra.AAC.1
MPRQVVQPLLAAEATAAQAHDPVPQVPGGTCMAKRLEEAHRLVDAIALMAEVSTADGRLHAAWTLLQKCAAEALSYD